MGDALALLALVTRIGILATLTTRVLLDFSVRDLS